MSRRSSAQPEVMTATGQTRASRGIVDLDTAASIERGKTPFPFYRQSLYIFSNHCFRTTLGIPQPEPPGGKPMKQYCYVIVNNAGHSWPALTSIDTEAARE